MLLRPVVHQSILSHLSSSSSSIVALSLLHHRLTHPSSSSSSSSASALSLPSSSTNRHISSRTACNHAPSSAPSSSSSSSSAFSATTRVSQSSPPPPPRVGDLLTLTRTFTADDVLAFGHASGDWNRVHYPDSYRAARDEAERQWMSDPATAKQPLPQIGIFRFPAPIVHGMLTASIIGTLFASRMPGAIYLQQSLKFIAPVYYNESVTAKIEILEIDQRKKRLTCRTWVEKETKEAGVVIVVDGEAKVMVEGMQ